MASYTTRIVLLLMLGAVLMQPVSAVHDKYTENFTDLNSATGITSQYSKGQTFTLTKNAGYSSINQITDVQIRINKAGNPGDISLYLYELDGGGLPTGSPLCQGILIESEVSTSYTWKTITFSSACMAPEDHIHTTAQYGFEISAPNADGTNLYNIEINNTDSYAGGAHIYEDVSGWHSAVQDIGFGIIYEVNRLPTQPTLTAPSNGAVNQTQPLTMSYSSTDADGDTITYWIQRNNSATGCSNTTSTSCQLTNLLSETTYSWTVSPYDGWELGAESATWVFTTADLIPPRSITNLSVETVTSSSIKWNWTNPIDVDFNKTMVYKNGVFLLNVTNEFYTMTSLNDNTNYTISTHTVDNSGNINSSWVNLTQKTDTACGSDSVCQLENGAVMYWTNSTYRYAQTVLITTESPYDAIVELDALWLNISKTGTPGDITIEIMETNATNYPSDHDITCTATVSEADVSTSFTIESISLPNDPTKGYTCTGKGSVPYIEFGTPTTLAIAITATGLDGSNYYSYRMSPTKTFTDGYLYLDSSGLYVEGVTDGVWVQNTTNDLYFELFYHPNRRPNAPTNTAPSNNANNTSVALNLEWSAATDDDGDAVTYTPQVSGGSSSFSCSLISSLSCFISSLTTNTTYDWFITPTDPWQLGTNSTQWNFTTRPPFNNTYVKWNGSDSASGEDWDNALDTISFAINYSVDSIYSVINIAPGNYTADPDLTVRTLTTFKCNASGPAQNASEIWCDYPTWNTS